jgi:hypothetical protein
LLCLAGLVVFAPMTISALFAPRGISNPEIIRRVGPVFLLIYCVSGLLSQSAGERAIAFTPAEIAFLFPAPFRRRQLLAYKLVFSAIVCILTVPILSLLLLKQASSFLAGFVGLSLAILFLQFFTLAVGLAAETIGAMAYNRRRKALLVLVMIALVAVAVRVSRDAAQLGALQAVIRLNQSWFLRTAIIPFRPFVEAFTAERVWPDLVGWAAVCIAIDTALVVFIFALNAQYMETSAAVSEKIYARLERMKRAGGIGMSRGLRDARFTLPMPPHWAGIGPIAWRQFSTAKREILRLVIFMFVLVPMLVPLVLETSPDQRMIIGTTMQTTLIGITMVITVIVPFDFRADLDRMAELKVLPVHPMALAVGQLVAPVVVLTAVQWISLALITLLFKGSPGVFVALLAFAPLANLFVIGLDNLLFLLFPLRLAGSNAVDFQLMGRAFLGMFGKMFSIGMIAALTVGIGVGMFYLTGQNWVATLAAAWLVLLACALVLARLVGWAFERFDVASDVPA